MSRRPVDAAIARQMSLLMRLQGASAPLTGAELFASVEGYRTSDPAEMKARDKRFERDRKALAALGFSIETVPDAEAPGDRARWRYRLGSGAGAVAEPAVNNATDGSAHPPADEVLALTADETLLLDAATRVWDADALLLDARRSALKLLRGAEPATPATAAVQLRIHTDAAFAPLRDAIASSRRVVFDYAKAGTQTPLERHVAPLELLAVDGRWLCRCYDFDRDAPRTFLLRRIVSEVVDAGPAEVPPLNEFDLRAQLDQLARTQPATLAVRTDSDAHVRLARRAIAAETPCTIPLEDGFAPLTVPSWDHELLADELAGFGNDVRVLAPASLAESVAQRWRRVAVRHRAPITGEERL